MRNSGGEELYACDKIIYIPKNWANNHRKRWIIHRIAHCPLGILLLNCFSSRSFLRYSDRLMDKQAAPWSNKSSSTSVRRNPIKCLWFSSLSLFFVLILLLSLRLFLPPGIHVFQYRLSLPILEIVLWTPLGGTNRQVKRLLLRGYGEIPIKINPIGEQDAKRQYC